MRQLVIEYVLEGHQRGYNFTSPTQGYSDAELKAIWRSAMPRGQGWGVETYRGAHSLKSFLLADGRVALSDVTVTDQRDESGRAGIRRAEIAIMPPGEYADHLTALLHRYPTKVQSEVFRKPGVFERRRIPKAKPDGQIVLSHPYHHAEGWLLVEALLVKAALDEYHSGWLAGKVIPFTTLALDYREESALVILPEDRARQLKNVTVVAVR
jgi:hypothetical protein